ncbi:hypothetical protein NC796_00670 [Aliifodinibius sp. S!AR15-10]|uniref:InlB B-repeat-containing protein n=1 Tax=Aliifodinibius sp. S!AR15-10 TaxID=2950437 RepID=UPI002862D869|nr:hypothetical protein [Aliifodinibius sp. S!AR15-10]MDR8389627.1 hypothetical protein [Aliifodinibius sp. S!AR15-10]
MKYYISCYFLFACLFFAGCSIGGSGGDEDDDDEGNMEEPVTTVRLNVTINPEDGGSVSHSSGTYPTGEPLKMEAIPSNGFGFVDWTGDIESTDNPLEFTIEEDTDLTVNFEATSSDYEASVMVADTTDTLNTLRFGQSKDASDGIDDLDFEAPPPPPVESLHAYFGNEKDLFWDFRSTTAGTLTWNLQLQPGQTDSLHISWDLDITVLNGSLMLRNDDAAIEVDMRAVNELSIAAGEADSLLIEYELGN